MKNNINKFSFVLMTSASFAALTTAAYAQNANETKSNQASETVIVTGVSRAVNKIDTSISVTAVDSLKLQNNVVRGTAEALRSIPGLRAEASAGGGNTNLGVRGIPVSTGGQKWVQIQEDGLPIQLFGDSNFNAPDAYYKVDSNLAQIQAVRGGSASTATTNGPGAILNFISKTGKTEGGSVFVETGLDYDDFKIDGGYGGRLSDSMYYFVGGHYQSGGDYRGLGYNGTEGGQIRASITKEFGDNNYFRISAKLIDKKEATFMPQVVAVNGGFNGTLTPNLAPGIGGVIGKPVGDVNNSPFLNNYLALDEGNVLTRDGADGIQEKVKSIGTELNFDVGNGWLLNNKTRYQSISAEFKAPFTDVIVDGATAFAAGGRYAGLTGTFFNGPTAGQAVNATTLRAKNGNALIQEIAQFDTSIKDAGNFVNDLKLQKTFDIGATKFDLTLGYFYMTQEFNQHWHWQQFIADVGNETSLISLSDGSTQGGQKGYNKGFNWGGNNRHYDFNHTAEAPYISGTAKIGDLTLDGSLRFDTIKQQGIQTEANAVNVDVNGDGVISLAETGVSVNGGPAANSSRVNFEVSHDAYSFGANYKLQPGLALFGRVSKGASFNSERQYGNSSAHNLASGALRSKDYFVDVVEQFEFGVKYRTSTLIPGRLDISATYFNADTEESQNNTTQAPPVPYDIQYESKGFELEGTWRVGNFTLDGSVTNTDAKIVSNTVSPTQNGKRPRRQAEWVWNMNASYTSGPFEIGGNVNGTSDSYAGFENYFIQEGYSTVGAYVNYNLTEKLTLSVNGNNLFDVKGITEAEEDAGRMFKLGSTSYNYISARPINGRTISARIKYTF